MTSLQDYLITIRKTDPAAKALLASSISAKAWPWHNREDVATFLDTAHADESMRRDAARLYREYRSWSAELLGRLEHEHFSFHSGMAVLPYAFTKLDALPGHVWLPLSRHYKPLGSPGHVHVDYMDHAHKAVVFKRDPATFLDVWSYDPRRNHMLWLADDGTPASVYFGRLTRLMQYSYTQLSQDDIIAFRRKRLSAAIRAATKAAGWSVVAPVVSDLVRPETNLPPELVRGMGVSFCAYCITEARRDKVAIERLKAVTP